LIESAGFSVVPFLSAQEFLQAAKRCGPSCLVLDVNLPGLNGLDLQSQLQQERALPIVFLTGHADVPTSVRAMKAGAVDFLSKPVRDEQLLEAIEQALERDRQHRSEETSRVGLRGRFASLTGREQQVFTHVIEGSLNKQIAHRLGVSEKTIKVHRARVMEKMQANSLADLVRLYEKLAQASEVEPSGSPASNWTKVGVDGGATLG
jgi:FixJ family two-component response regulator